MTTRRILATIACTVLALFAIVLCTAVGVLLAATEIGNNEAIFGVFCAIVGLIPPGIAFLTWDIRRAAGRDRLHAYWGACLFGSLPGVAILLSAYIFYYWFFGV